MAAVSPSADAFLYHVIDFRGSFFVPAPSSQHTNQENKVSLMRLVGNQGSLACSPVSRGTMVKLSCRLIKIECSFAINLQPQHPFPITFCKIKHRIRIRMTLKLIKTKEKKAP